MNSIIWIVYGIALGFVFIVMAGLLSIQTRGLKAGALFNLNNEMVAVVGPTEPVLPLVGLAAMSGLVMYALTILMRNRDKLSRISLTASFSGATILLVTAAFILSSVRGLDPELPLGVPMGPAGWLEFGGVNPAVHAVLVFAIGSLWLYSSPVNSQPDSDGSKGTNKKSDTSLIDATE